MTIVTLESWYRFVHVWICSSATFSIWYACFSNAHSSANLWDGKPDDFSCRGYLRAHGTLKFSEYLRLLGSCLSASHAKRVLQMQSQWWWRTDCSHGMRSLREGTIHSTTSTWIQDAWTFCFAGMRDGTFVFWFFQQVVIPIYTWFTVWTTT